MRNDGTHSWSALACAWIYYVGSSPEATTDEIDAMLEAARERSLTVTDASLAGEA